MAKLPMAERDRRAASQRSRMNACSTNAPNTCSRRWSSATSPKASRWARARCRGTPGWISRRPRIRNVMADLEEMGFIASPHTSAGRIPTPRGYRFFVDTPAHDQAARPRRDRAARRRAARPTGRSSSSTPASQLLSHLTQFAGVVMTPQAARAVVPPHRVPAPVREAHPADHRHARRRRAEPHPAHRPAYTPAELIEAANFFNQHYAGLPFEDAARALRGGARSRCARTSSG